MSEPETITQSILIQPEETLPPWTIDDMPDTIRSAAEAMGWKKLMPVQEAASPYLAAGRDMIVQSRTGSGKTGAFLIPLLMRVNPKESYPQAILLVPTMELAVQVYGEFEHLSANLKLKGALIYGGVGYGKQLEAMKKGAQVIIGTPGRVLDHIGRRSLDLGKLSTLVFDEADEMLSMGFYPDMKELRRYIPRERTTWMFSATMPYKVQMLAEEFMQKTEFLSLSAGQETIETMEHRLYEAPTMDKDQILIRLIEMERPDSAIIFCNMKSDVEYVANVLKGRGYNAEMISGDLKQNQREQVMQGIRDNRYRFLVATDVAARGIDISDLSHVFLYDIPMDPELYVHRAGRTARAGNTGVAISLVGNMSDRTTLKRIGRKYGIEFVEMPTPTEDQVAERIGERLTIHLEERWRSLTSAVQTNMSRFELVVKSLSETEEGQSLLAMLLADLYQATFNASQIGSKKSSGISRTSAKKKTEAEESSPAEEIEQIAEGLISHLEDRWRSLTPGVRRRMVRFESVVKSLTESEEERSLLAMLLADLYQEMRNTPQKESSRDDKKTGTSRKAAVKSKRSETAQESSSSQQNPPRKKKRRRRPNKPGTSQK